MNTNETIILARKYRNEGSMSSSAQLCLADAVKLQSDGDLESAKRRAIDSLRYSVGIFHKDYQRASK